MAPPHRPRQVNPGGPANPVSTSRLMRACRGQAVDATPVWFMRQAGAYIPEHRRLLERHGLLGLTKTPDLCARVTALPVETLGVDAAVMYADIIVPLGGMGVDFHYEEGVGPIIHEPIQRPAQVAALTPLEPAEAVPFTLEAIQRARERLGAQVPLIGFSGGPFTLAAYLIDGRPSRSFERTKAFMYRHPQAWHALMDRLTGAITAYLEAQIAAGIDVVKIFDSWIGVLQAADYRTGVLPYTQRILQAVGESGRPRIHFGVGTGHLLEDLSQLDCEVLGVDWRVPLDQVRRVVGETKSLQGNLDPALVLAPWEQLEEGMRAVLSAVAAGTGVATTSEGSAESSRRHIFSLGHRVPLTADPQVLRRLVGAVHQHTAVDSP